ncbi:MAG TPA: 16S rRNA (cytosine(1402)-N(4))-methyltransferase RsmH, partial [Candidatus Baltobacteraceae bacterium]|nr:16S rRNA (cytosine(1402)-N(4))-methyltransferase RsmH [Candidatus Baltobacteraceae bacterium]
MWKSGPRSNSAQCARPKTRRSLSPRSSGCINGNADIHVAVLLAETLDGLGVRDGGVYVDATFGAGGHTRAILERGAERVIAFDLDADARERVGGDARIFLIHASFAGIAAALGELGIGRVDGVLFDFGVSSMQLDQPERGFSFQIDGPLDMRMDASGGMTAYDLLSSLEERELAEILHSYGEEPSARRIARAIIAARKRGELPERTGALARMVAGVVHRPGHRE